MKRLLSRGVQAVCLLAATGLAAPTLATAQGTDPGAKKTAADSGTSTDKKTGVDEIVITARKKAENLEDTPLAVTALTGDKLEDQQISNISQIAEFAPNLTFDTSAPLAGGSSASSVYIRGVGSSEFSLATDPGVGIYVDGVYLARSIGGVLDLVDPERVEILRGPQGTLFGRNAVGGAISIISRAPETEIGGRAKFTYGTDNLMRWQGTLNLPVSETLRSRVSFSRTRQDGYVKDVSNSFAKLGDQDRWAVRGTVVWEATDTLRFTLNADSTREREQAAPNVLVGINPINPTVLTPPGQPPAPSFVTIANGIAQQMGLCANPNDTSNPNCFNRQFLLGPTRTAGGFTSPRPVLTSTASKPIGPDSDLDLWGSSLTAQWDLGSAVTLKSITSYRRLDSFFGLDLDHSPLVILGDVNDFTQAQTTQEFQLLGRALDNRLDWTLGTYYFRETGDNKDVVEFPLGVGALRSGGDFLNRSLAGFGQATYAITPQLKFTAGVRYSYESKRFDTNDQRVIDTANIVTPAGPVTIPIGAPLITNPGERRTVNRDRAWSPQATLAYNWTDDLMTYASYSQGFKAGGFTQRIFPPLPAVPRFTKEKLYVYEIGAKASFLDSRVRLNAAAFHSDYDDLQINVFEGVAPVLKNAGTATIQGVELEAALRPTPELGIDLGVGYIDAEYDKVNNLAVGLTKDNEFVNTPEWSASAGITYTFDLGPSIGSLTARGGWSYRDEIFNDAINTPALRQGKISLYDASLLWRSPSGKWGVGLVGKNLGDRHFIVSGASVPQSGLTEASFDRGRVFSLTVERDF